MDGRPHPPAWAPHTFRGFSTGQFVGQRPRRADHAHQDGRCVRGNGVPAKRSDDDDRLLPAHGDHLTNVTVVNDPVFLSEPMVRSNDYYRQPVDHGAWLYACDDGEQILDRRADYVPHYLFGKQPFAREFATRYKPAARREPDGAAVDVSRAAGAAAHRQRRTRCSRRRRAGRRRRARRWVEPRDGKIHVLPIRNNVYMLVGDGGNIVVQTGDQGAFVVDTGEGKLSDKVLAAIRTLSAKPIQFIANTSFRAEHTGGNAALARRARTPACRDRSSSRRRRAA